LRVSIDKKDLGPLHDKFLLAVESRDLSQAEKSIISFFFPKMSDGYWRTSFSIFQQTPLQMIFGDAGCWVIYFLIIAHNTKAILGIGH
jgi:hypothetical protein